MLSLVQSARLNRLRCGFLVSKICLKKMFEEDKIFSMESEQFEQNDSLLSYKKNEILARENLPLYVPPTGEEIEKMSESLSSIKELLEGSSFVWQLDGGINISGYEKDYVRNHKDIDVSVLENDIDKLIECLNERRAKLFARIPESIARTLSSDTQLYEMPGNIGVRNQDEERREYDKLLSCTEQNIVEAVALAQEFGGIIFKVDENERPIDSLYSIDLHIPKQKGNEVEIRNGVFVLVEDYLYRAIIDSSEESGGELVSREIQAHLSPKSVFIFHKLHEGRTRDESDLIYLFSKMEPEERSTVKEKILGWLEKEENTIENGTRIVIENVWKFIDDRSVDISNYNEIRKAISSYPDVKVKLHRDREGTDKIIDALTQFFFQCGKDREFKQTWREDEDSKQKFVNEALKIVMPKHQVELARERLLKVLDKSTN